jgi:hypothetical protein
MPMKNPTLDAFFPRGIRNFNPGNIENGPFARSQPGYVGSDGRFAQFDTMDHGIDAQSSLLQGYGNKGLNTLNAIINRYAPSSDGNNTNASASFVSKKMGVDPNQPLDMNDPNVRRNMAMAMGRFENGMSPVDPRSWQASATPQQATAAPMQLPGATPEQPPGAQSISLGDQENSQPFNNIGSTLANMGAAIASLDNRGTGIASLNASRVAGNLAAQENAREAQGGWKYVGQTQNGQGLMFQNSRGEIRVEPLNSQFAGQREPETIRTLRMLQSDPSLMDTMKEKSGDQKLEPSLSEDTRRMYAMRAIKGDNTWTREIGGDKQGAVDKRAIDEEQTKVAKELGLNVDDIMKSRTELRYRNKVADRIAQIDVNTETAANKIDAAATNLIETSKQYPRGDVRFIEGLKQKWDEQTNDPKLQALKTAVDAFSLDYATALNPQKTSPTVDDVRNARNKILTTMNQESLEAAVNIVQREVGSIRQNARRTHEQWFGSSDKTGENNPPATNQNKRLKYNPQTGELE